MSSKRRADKYLTDQNWNEEDAAEEAGKFEPAARDVLKQRTYKKAKRRINQQGENNSAFKGFSGLTATKPTPGSNGFQGFKMNMSPTTFTVSPKNTELKVEPCVSEKPAEKESIVSTTSISPFSSISPFTEKTQLVEETPAPTTDDEKSPLNSKMSKFNRHLIALNKSVSKWIAGHVEKDPLCDLTPIFDDYQQHYSDIEDKYASVSSSQSETSQEMFGDRDDKPALTFKELCKPDTILPVQAAKPKTPPKNPLGIATTSSSASSSPFRGFGTQGKPGTSDFAGFQFGSKMVAATSSISASRDTQTSAVEEDDYVPPQPDSNVVEETDAFYTKRCKLFYMKDGSYADKGVGHLHLKNVSNKTQLVVRADTNLGNVLLNIILNSAMPVAKQGKNNVVVSCVPNPPIDEKSSDKVVPMLIRVKTADDADELFEILNKKKKECD